MSALGAELLLPAHGLPIAGAARIARVLDDVASALEHVVNETLSRMNAGETLDAIVQGVRVPAHLLERPYLRPVYDEPEFVVRNVWRLYGGWTTATRRARPPRRAARGEFAALRAAR
jgi:alkyl sulfatase BDS1-like metallo-beta-lactamase superfamily hydrolase